MAEHTYEDIPLGPDERTEFNVVGRRGILRYDGYPKASGEAMFTRDVYLPGMLYARVLASPYPHAKIKSIDTSKAKAYPGVEAVITYEDLEVISDTAYYEGELIGAAVCADTDQICVEALKLLDVEWEELPFVIDQEEALKPGAPLVRPDLSPDNNIALAGHFEAGDDVEKGFKEADLIIEDTIKWGSGSGGEGIIAHGGAEPWSCVTKWDGDILTLWISEQKGAWAQPKIAAVLGIPISKLNMRMGYLGYSGGHHHSNYLKPFYKGVAFASRAAKITHRPVKLQFSRRDEFNSIDMGLLCHVKVGVKNDGTVTALQKENIINGGSDPVLAYNWAATPLMSAHMEWFSGETKIPCILINSTSVWTDTPQTFAVRCELNHAAFAFGTVFDIVANELGMDSTEVALKNAARPEPSLKECLEDGKKAIGWDEKWHAPGTKKLPNGKYHGIGLYWSHEWGVGKTRTASAAVRICVDGSVEMVGSASDVGVAPNTTYAMILAEELGVRFEDVSFPYYQDPYGFRCMGPGGSVGLGTNSLPWEECGKRAKEALLERAALVLSEGLAKEVKAEELDIRDSVIYIKEEPATTLSVPDALRGTKCKIGKGLGEPGAKIGDPTDLQVCVSAGDTGGRTFEHLPAYYQAHFCEVEVDPETGHVEVTNIVNTSDVGKIIYPESCEGQQYGGSTMTWGRAITEEFVYDPTTGVQLNGNFLDYKMTTILDCGPVECILKETRVGDPEETGSYRLIGIGEDMATTVNTCISNAVCNAIGKRLTQPITPDKVLKALGKI